MAKTSMKDLNKVMRKLAKEVQKIEGHTMKGFIRAGIIIRRDMDETSPMIPVGKTGNLRGSWGTNPYYIGKTPFFEMYFGADYAVWVHEMVGDNINWNRPGSGAKFFEAALKRNKVKVLGVIKEEAIIK